MGLMHALSAILCAVSVAYFALDRHASLAMRIAVSGHGVLFALAFYLALLFHTAVPNPTQAMKEVSEAIFVFFNLAAIGLVLLSLVKFDGPKLLHFSLLLYPIAVYILLFVGSLMISRDSL